MNDVLATAVVNVVAISIDDKSNSLFSMVWTLIDVSVDVQVGVVVVPSGKGWGNERVVDDELVAEEESEVPTSTDLSCVICFAGVEAPCSKCPEVVKAPVAMVIVCDVVVSVILDVVVSSKKKTE